MKTITRRKTVANTVNLSDCHPRLAQIYAARGITSNDELDTALSGLLPADNLMGMDAACARLFIALQQQQKVLVVGDFDADGATSTSLAVSALRTLGLQQIEFLVPNRFEYGYGLTPEIVEVAQRWQPDVIITVDNGISSIAGVDAANAHGIDVIITDHHLPADELPAAVAIVNPNQRGDTFASKHLAGVGVIFYVMLALRRYCREQNWFTNNNQPEPNMGQFLDLVALGTVADVVTLDKNNRILVKQGLQRIRAGKCRPGITAILQIAKRRPEAISSGDLGFAVGPRLNAAGRLDDMSLGIDCLLSESLAQALEKAQVLDELNKERRVIEADMQQQAMQALEQLHLSTDGLPLGLCLYEQTWHQGVIGILAGRIKERIHRPVIAFAQVSDDELKGSARSVEGIHIRDILDAVAAHHPGLISKFGGHAMAAGLSLPVANLAAFRHAFVNEIQQHVDEADLVGEILSDGELDAETINLAFAEQLRDAGPFGQGFPEPCFDGMFNIVEQRIVGTNHLKLTLTLSEFGEPIQAIAFNVDTQEWPNYRCRRAHVAYRLDVNEFRGFRNPQLIIEQIQALSHD